MTGLEEGSRGWRQKKKSRSKGLSTDRGESAPLPSGGGLPPTKVEQVLPPEAQANGGGPAASASLGTPASGAPSEQPSSSAGPALAILVAPTGNGLAEPSVGNGSGADTATPEPSLKPDSAPSAARGGAAEPEHTAEAIAADVAQTIASDAGATHGRSRAFSDSGCSRALCPELCR